MYFNLKVVDGEVTVLAVENELAKFKTPTTKWYDGKTGNGWAHDWDLTSELAKSITAYLNKSGKKSYLFVDRGESVSPRFSVCVKPEVGDEVSKSFNGDSYPVGKITKVSESGRRVETSSGTVFYRKRETASWVNKGMWFMIAGSISEWNPSF